MAKDITGQRFGRLVAIQPTQERDNKGYTLWRCKCDCGNEIISSLRYLGHGTSSCGCYAKEQTKRRNTKHGKCHTRLYRIHKGMMERCFKPNTHEYENYGGRGISVCEEWRNFDSFYEWAVSNGYNSNLTLDRIDSNGDYEPRNCRWTTMKKQQRNRRNNVFITYNGETHCLSEWAEIAGIRYGTFLKRIYAGWSMERAMTQPITNR